MKTALLPCLLLALGTAPAFASPIEEVGVDLEFSCASADGARTACEPEPGKRPGYAALANWRFVDATENCITDETIGYAAEGPWVSGECQARLRAPNLRFGDEFNAQRLDGPGQGSTSSIEADTPRNEGPGCVYICWESEVSDRHFKRLSIRLTHSTRKSIY